MSPARAGRRWLPLLALLLAAGGIVAQGTLGPRYPRTPPRAALEILRDSDGAPFIQAANRWDLFYGQGYATAADRIFQLDWSRRGLLGQRAAVAGRRFIVSDFRVRALGLEQTVQDLYRQLDPEAREACAAYAAGVNRWLATHPLPREFRRLGYRPAAWRPEDCLAIWRGMALTLTDLGDDLAGPDTGALFPAGAGEAPGATAFEGAAAFGSNGWAAAGARTRSGRPLLAGDPHLAFEVPGPLHRCMLSAPGVAFTGFDLPGVPGLAFGRSARFAWTVTAFEGDAADVFRYPVDPAHAGRYRTSAGWRDVEKRRPLVWMRLWGPFALPVFWQALELTPEGPVVRRPPGGIDVLRWAGGRPLPGESILTVHVLDVEDRAGFERCLARQGLPDVNLVYADAEGHIGHYIAGMLPRRVEHQGPRDGLDSTLAWRGFIPWAELPRRVDPPEGYVFSANGPPPAGPNYLGHGWGTAREERLRTLFAAGDTLTAADFMAWQLDTQVPLARETVDRRLGRLERTALSPVAREAMARLVEWDGRADTAAVAPTLYRAWSAFGEDAAALERACRWLTRRAGAEEAGWTWGRLHQARLEHPLAELDSTWNPPLFPRAGDRGTLNVAGYARFDTTAWPPMVATHGPALRFVTDFAVEGETRGILMPGVSGDPDSPHRLDQLDDWRAGRLRLFPAPGVRPAGPAETLRP